MPSNLSINALRALLLCLAILHYAPARASKDLPSQAQEILNRGDYQALTSWLEQHGKALSTQQRNDLLFNQIRVKQPAAASALLKAGFDPHAQRPDGVNAAMMAAYYGDADLVARFLDAGADPLQRADNGYALFDYALEAGQVESMRLLIDRWLKDPSELSGDQAKREAQSLRLARAIIGEDYERLAELANAGGLNSYNRSNYAPLPLAVRLNRAPAVDLLLANGAYASIGNDGNDEAIPLNQAARGGRMEIARQLLLWQASPNKPNGRGYTAVMLAAMYGHTQMLELLLDHGGRAAQGNNAGDNAMSLAMQYGAPASATILINHGADAEQAASQQRLALINGEAAELDAQSAQQLDQVDRYGLPTAFYALMAKESAVLRKLLALGASPDQSIAVGAKLSLLQMAVILNRADLVGVLVEAGADLDYQNQLGEDAYAIATRLSRADLVAQLQRPKA